MSNNLLQIYQNLPRPIRSVAASLRGFYLRSLRYGPETELLVTEALERDYWSPERWKIWQEERLSYILHQAATQVPYYRNYWSQQRLRGNRASWKILKNWPVLKKEMIRDNPHAFVADGNKINKMFCSPTSGTTGTPLSIYIKKDTLKEYYALNEARTRRWHGVSISDRWGILGGQQIVPIHKQKPPFWVFNLGLNQLYLSTFHISPANAKFYVDALHRYDLNHMIVYPSSAFILADTIIDNSLIAPEMKVIFSNAEMLLSNHREVISRAFRCSVRNTYGMSEIAAAASECEKGKMHIWPEVGVIEVLEDFQDVPANKTEAGRFILTSLLNKDMPLIRYEVGDRGILDNSENKCTCGRYLPEISAIEGRFNDLVITPDGRQIFSLGPVFFNMPVKEAQIIQNEIGIIIVRIVAAADYTDNDAKNIVQRLRDRLGDIEISLNVVNSIPRSKDGKFRAIISHVSSHNSKNC